MGGRHRLFKQRLCTVAIAKLKQYRSSRTQRQIEIAIRVNESQKKGSV